MIEHSVITDALNKAAASYHKCWSTLIRFKTQEFSHDLTAMVWEFQPTLADAIFELDDLYRKVATEIKATVKTKKNTECHDFTNQMRWLGHYKKTIIEALSIGKSLGDAFAWLFYCNQRSYLREHFKHEQIKHTPPEIGGRGELECIKNIIGTGEQFPLYHGITSILRIGDVSFFDTNLRSLIAIAELKSSKINDSTIQIQAHLVGKGEKPLDKLYFKNADHNCDSNNAGMPPQNMIQ